MAVQVAAFGAAFTGALALRLSERFWLAGWLPASPPSGLATASELLDMGWA